MNRNRWWVRVLQLVLFSVAAWGIYRFVAPEVAKLRAADILQYRPSVPSLLLATLLIVIVNVMHAWLWRSIAVALAGSNLSIRSAMRMYFVSSLGRYIPGKFWQIAGLAALAQRVGFSPVAATAASLVGQLAFLTTGVLFLAVLLPSLLHGAAALAAVALLALGLAAFVIGATSTGQSLRRRAFARMGPRVAQAGELLDRITTGTAARWWLWYALSWLILGAAFAVFVSAFVPGQGSQYRFLAGVAAASYLGGYLFFFSPAGLGVREGIMLPLLATTLPASAALVISIGSRLLFTAGELVPILLIPLLPESRAQSTPSREVP